MNSINIVRKTNSIRIMELFQQNRTIKYRWNVPIRFRLFRVIWDRLWHATATAVITILTNIITF